MERIARGVTVWTGSTQALVMACAFIVVWLLMGPLFEFSDTWQLIANTFTTLINFLMVFILQRAINKESLVMNLKLNEIIAALHGASNRLINVEDLSEDEVQRLHRKYRNLAKRIDDHEIKSSHSIEEED